MTGWVQKVSNLILNMNIVVRDAKTGQVILSKSVDMRGNTDESWSRALDWLVDRYLLAPGVGVLLNDFHARKRDRHRRCTSRRPARRG